MLAELVRATPEILQYRPEGRPRDGVSGPWAARSVPGCQYMGTACEAQIHLEATPSPEASEGALEELEMGTEC